MKSLKGYTRSSLLHSDAYIALLRTLDVVDDTVAVQKSVLAELQQLPEKKGVNPLEDDENDKEDDNESPLLELALSDTGSKLFLLLLAKDDEARTKYFDPLELEILRPNPTVKEGDEEVPTSKKSANTRRVELLQYMKSQIIDCCINHSKDLLSSRCGSKVLKEVYNAFPSKELGNSIVQSCDDDSDEGENLSVFEDSIGHLSIKGILNYDANREDKSGFVTKAMVEKYKDHLLDDIGSSNRGAFVLASLLKSDKTGAVRRELKNQMKDIKSRMKECKKNAKPYAGFEALLNDLK
jgi:pumilio family protein 6